MGKRKQQLLPTTIRLTPEMDRRLEAIVEQVNSEPDRLDLPLSKGDVVRAVLRRGLETWTGQ